MVSLSSSRLRNRLLRSGDEALPTPVRIRAHRHLAVNHSEKLSIEDDFRQSRALLNNLRDALSGEMELGPRAERLISKVERSDGDVTKFIKNIDQITAKMYPTKGVKISVIGQVYEGGPRRVEGVPSSRIPGVYRFGRKQETLALTLSANDFRDRDAAPVNFIRVMAPRAGAMSRENATKLALLAKKLTNAIEADREADLADVLRYDRPNSRTSRSISITSDSDRVFSTPENSASDTEVMSDVEPGRRSLRRRKPSRRDPADPASGGESKARPPRRGRSSVSARNRYVPSDGDSAGETTKASSRRPDVAAPDLTRSLDEQYLALKEEAEKVLKTDVRMHDEGKLRSALVAYGKSGGAPTWNSVQHLIKDLDRIVGTDRDHSEAGEYSDANQRSYLEKNKGYYSEDDRRAINKALSDVPPSNPPRARGRPRAKSLGR